MVRRVGVWANAATNTIKMAEIDRFRIPQTISLLLRKSRRCASLVPNRCVGFVPIRMRVGVFTPLLSQVPLPEVLKKLTAHSIATVELGTGNYPGDAHCKLAMLKDRGALAAFKKTIADRGF